MPTATPAVGRKPACRERRREHPTEPGPLCGRLLGDAGERPDAMIVLTEVSPLLVLDAARRLGCRVPDDLLVVSASEDGVAAHTDPAVTTLSMQPALIAEAGIHLLVEVLDLGITESRGVEVPTRLDIRASSLRAR
ncbi:substrate-binding domain-containing protein [Embleya sp. NPDC005971]|uniref:substrate-binding domain-containing protein n=1 Tax=Embleya sp. NPDC005971 TaxID=3156724 RepID=UPI0033E27EFE